MREFAGNMKRLFAVVMTVTMLVSMMAVQVSAFDSDYITDIGATRGQDLPTSLDPGEIWIDQDVEVIDDEEAIFEVTFRAMGRDYVKETGQSSKPLDLVLLLDTSGSMGSYDGGSTSRTARLKDAATSAVDTVMGQTGNRVALIDFDYDSVVLTASASGDFTTDTATLHSEINGLDSYGTTDIVEAFQTAETVLANRQDKTREAVVILITDGVDYYKGPWDVVTAAQDLKDNQNPRIYTIGIGLGDTSDSDYPVALATLQPTEANTANYRPSGVTFNHKYWEDESVLTSSDTSGLMDVLQGIIVNELSTKPVKYDTTAGAFEDIVFTELIEDYELYDEATYFADPDLEWANASGDIEVTWTLSGDDFETLPANETEYGTFTSSDFPVNEISFRVRLKDSIDASGTYYTNKLAKAEYSIEMDSNPYPYDFADNTEYFDNKGWTTLENPYVDLKLIINKDVDGPVIGDNTFDFSVYYSETDPTPIELDGETVFSATVTDNGTASVEVDWKVREVVLLEGGPLTLYVEEISTEPSTEWSYENGITNRKAVTFSASMHTGEVTFTNVYEPITTTGGAIRVVKNWEDGTNPAGEQPQEAVVTLHQVTEITTGPALVTSGAALDVEVGTKTITRTAGSVLFEDLDFSDDTKNIYYYVTESAIADYTASISPSKLGLTEDYPTGTITVTNTYDEPVIVDVGSIDIDKSVVGSDSITASSGTFSFELVVSNDGDLDLSHVLVTDVLSGPGAGIFSLTGPSSVTLSGNVFTIGDLAAGDSVTITYDVTVDEYGTYYNLASVSAIDESQMTYYDYDDDSVKLSKPSSPIRTRTGTTTTTVPTTTTTTEPEVTTTTVAPTFTITEAPIPEASVTMASIEIEDPEMPETGGMPMAGFSLIGTGLFGLGMIIKKRNK